jgi:uncharacterized membrane protein
MNRMLVVIFDSETKANEGVRAMRQLHAEGGITVYGIGVIARGAAGKVEIKEAMGQGGMGIGMGLAVGSLIGLLAGPVGLVVGAVTGTIAGAVRDFWVAGVGLDFLEQAERDLAPGKVAVIAEVEEEWTVPVDSQMETLGGVVFRRARADIAEEQFDGEVATMKSEYAMLKAEVKRSSGDAKTKLEGKLASAKTTLDAAAKRSKKRLDDLEGEAESRLGDLKSQLERAKDEFKSGLEVRAKRVRDAYARRTAGLTKAWEQAKDALAA